MMKTCNCCGRVVRAFGVNVRGHKVYFRQGARPFRLCDLHREAPGFAVHHGDGKAWMIMVDMPQAMWIRGR